MTSIWSQIISRNSSNSTDPLPSVSATFAEWNHCNSDEISVMVVQRCKKLSATFAEWNYANRSDEHRAEITRQWQMLHHGSISGLDWIGLDWIGLDMGWMDLWAGWSTEHRCRQISSPSPPKLPSPSNTTISTKHHHLPKHHHHQTPPPSPPWSFSEASPQLPGGPWSSTQLQAPSEFDIESISIFFIVSFWTQALKWEVYVPSQKLYQIVT